MAIKKRWVCDGCDSAVDTELEAETSDFHSIKVTAGSWGADLILCLQCHDKLLDQIDPRKWMRTPRTYARMGEQITAGNGRRQ